MTLPRLCAEDVRGIYAIIPTPAKPGAESWQAQDTVDTDEIVRMVDRLIQDGVNGILALGTLGECATVTWDEHQKVIAAIVEGARKRVPVITGTTSLNTRDTIMKTRYARDVGADGVMNGAPMWCAPSEDTIVRYYQDLAEACPDMAIVVYDNPQAFKFNLTPPLWARLAEIPQVVATKFSLNLNGYLPILKAVRGRIRIMPIDMQMYPSWRLAPEETVACWSSSASCGPAPVLALCDALRCSDDARAKAIHEDIVWACQTLLPGGNFEVFSMYNIPLEKLRMSEAGYVKAGPCRPPYFVIPEAFAEGACEAGRRWAQIARKYAGRE